VARADVPRRLQDEFRRLQGLGLGTSLHTVSWRPGGRQDVDAEVIGLTAHVYATNQKAAVVALRHEMFHFELVACAAPYVRVINRLLSEVNEEVYRRQERLAEALAELLEGRRDRSRSTDEAD